MKHESNEASPRPELLTQLLRFSASNDFADDKVREIKAKLQNLYHYIQPEPEAIPQDKPTGHGTTALEEFHVQLRRLDTLNEHISDILTHLSIII